MNVSAFENECFRSLQHYSVHLQKLGARGVVLLLDERRALSMGVEEWQSFLSSTSLLSLLMRGT